MAGVNGSPEMRGQFAAIAELRWNMFRHSLRTRRGKAELVSHILIGAFFFIFGLGGSVGFGAAAWYFLRENKAEWLALLLWPVFLFWQFFPIMASAFTENLDSSNLLRFPLSYRSYFLVRIAYGLFDPATTVGSLWLLGIALGIAVASPGLLPAAAIVLAAFAAVNVLLTRVIFSWVERWLAQRRTREIFGVLLFLLLISFQLIGPLMERYSRKVRPSAGMLHAVERVSLFQRVLPPGLAAESIAKVSRGQFAAALAWLAALSACGAAFVALLHFRLHAEYQGENLSEVQMARTSPGKREPLRLGWELPSISAPVAAVFEKELRVLSRSGPMLLTLVMPIVALFVLRIGRWSSAAHGLNATMLRAADFGFPIGAIYALLMLTNLVYNNFGAEGSGMQFFLVSPIRFREIVLGKNLAHTACLVGEVALVGLAVKFVYGAPAPAMAAATLAALLFAAPLDFAAGNLFSLYSPKRVDYGTFGRQKASQLTVLASFGVQIFMAGVAAGTIFLSRHYGNLWLATPVFLLFAAVSIPVYFWTLGRVDKIAMDHRETLVAELSKA